MKKTIQLNGVDPMIFAGVNDQNIKIIDTNFDSNIVLRGNTLIVEGAKKDIEKLEILINDILFTINKKGFRFELLDKDMNPIILECVFENTVGEAKKSGAKAMLKIYMRKDRNE